VVHLVVGEVGLQRGEQLALARGLLTFGPPDPGALGRDQRLAPGLPKQRQAEGHPDRHHVAIGAVALLVGEIPAGVGMGFGARLGQLGAGRLARRVQGAEGRMV